MLHRFHVTMVTVCARVCMCVQGLIRGRLWHTHQGLILMRGLLKVLYYKP